ncbi:MAG: hypothetical protein BZ151_09430, partial [Desulfobacca sp. 4484_104]
MLLLQLSLLFSADSSRAEYQSKMVGILISREIRPYLQMVEGLEENLELPSARIFLDKFSKPYSQESRLQELQPADFKVMVAVGPQALSYLHDRHWPGPVVYAMVLNPERFFWESAHICGISLNLSSWEQLLATAKVFPKIERLGILFNPEKNLKWFKR